MKLHEREGISGFGWRMAVPGGWLYDNGCAAFGFVPDPTAEHVAHGAGGAAADAIYRDAVADCCEVLGNVAVAFGIDATQAHGLIAALRGVSHLPTLRAGEAKAGAALVPTDDAIRAGRDSALREAADLVKRLVVHWREVGQPLNQNDRAGFILEARILALAEPEK